MTNEAQGAAPTEPTQATPAASAPVESPKTNLGEKFNRDAAFQRALAAVAKISGETNEAAEADAPAGETPTAEAPADAAAQTTPAAKELESDRWREAIQARKRAEREAAERMRAAEEAERSYKSKAEALTPFEKAQELIKAGRKLEAAKVLGIDYADITREMVEGPKPEDPTAELKAQIEELKAWKAEQARVAQEQQARDAELGAVRMIRDELAEAGDIALLRKHDGWEHEVVQLMKIRWEQIGWRGDAPPITPQEAARELNAALKEQRRAELRAVSEADPELLRELGFIKAEDAKPKTLDAEEGSASAMPRTAPRTLSGAHESEAGRLPETLDVAELRRRAILRAREVFGSAPQE
ncbi:MAG: hypothetical protein E6Q97_10085 [Desulfurellales bacterium]|nr:MAG: hypothetical protein E6Q97_10085 [Desulfurellales bacterium]